MNNDKSTQPKLIEKWPLGINKSMDKHAAVHGFGYWSCVSLNGNENWLRRDGEILRATFKHFNGYLEDLKNFDLEHPFSPRFNPQEKAQQWEPEDKFTENCPLFKYLEEHLNKWFEQRTQQKEK